MAVGPTLGTGVFLAGGQALAAGGPASLLVSYISLSLLVYFMATSVAEVATYAPSRHGVIIMHAFRYMNKSLGFAVASLRWYTMAMFVPYELTTAMVNIGLWNPGGAIAIRLVIVTSLVVVMNVLPERIFKSSVTLLYRVKIGTLASLVVLSLSICLGGATGYDHWGLKYWKRPGAMKEYLVRGPIGKFLGLLQCLHLSTVAFTFVPELIVHRAELSETEDGIDIAENIQPAPKSTIPKTVVTDVFQTTFPYILSSFAMGVMAPYNEPLLTNGGTGAGLSPFVIGINNARIRILPVTATLAILVSSIGSAQTFLHLASHSLTAMAEVGYGPSMFKTRNSWGVPWVAVAFTSIFPTLAFLSVATTSSVMTTYLMLFLNSSGYLSWILSCIIYRRYRQHLRVHEVTTAYRYSIQPFGNYFGLLLSTLLLFSNGLISAVPGRKIGTRGARITMAYFSIPLFFFLYLMHRFGEATIQSRLHSLENSVNDPREPQPTGNKHITLPRESHIRSRQASTAIEMDQVWVMAREA